MKAKLQEIKISDTERRYEGTVESGLRDTAHIGCRNEPTDISQ